MIVYDVIVNGKIQETIRPKRQKLREIYDYVNEQMKDMRRKYGQGVHVKRRMVY